jgi:biopolymer transport protein ExbB
VLSLNPIDLIQQGGFAMYPLVACSVLALAVIVERAWILVRVVRPVKPVIAAVMNRVARMEFEEARMMLRTARTPAAEVFAGALAPRPENGAAPRSAESTLREMERKRQELLHGLKRHLWVLGTVGSLAPFIGLFGTVLGIVRSFHSMAITGQGGFAVVAAGISEALIATAAGLIVAIVALGAYNTLISQINAFGAFLKFRIEELAHAREEREVPHGHVAAVR